LLIATTTREGFPGLGRKGQRARLCQGAVRVHELLHVVLTAAADVQLGAVWTETPAPNQALVELVGVLDSPVAMSITASDGLINPLVATIAYRLSGVATMFRGSVSTGDVLASRRDAPAVRQQHAAHRPASREQRKSAGEFDSATARIAVQPTARARRPHPTPRRRIVVGENDATHHERTVCVLSLMLRVINGDGGGKQRFHARPIYKTFVSAGLDNGSS
jgi:hypothetical protein